VNAVSELSQSGAENRILFSSILFFHAILGILFAVGIILHHQYSEAKLIFIGGILYLVVGLSNSLSSTIFPQDPIGGEASFQGFTHLVLVGITVLSTFFLLPLIGQGVYHNKNWKSFRVFTFVCLPIIALSGVLSPVVISYGIEVMGVTERIVAYTFYTWIVVLAYLLIKEHSKQFNSSVYGNEK
jgi:hypothetical protein